MRPGLYNRMIQILACGFQISQFVKDLVLDRVYANMLQAMSSFHRPCRADTFAQRCLQARLPNRDDSYEGDQGSQNKMQNHLLLSDPSVLRLEVMIGGIVSTAQGNRHLLHTALNDTQLL